MAVLKALNIKPLEIATAALLELRVHCTILMAMRVLRERPDERALQNAVLDRLCYEHFDLDALCDEDKIAALREALGERRWGAEALEPADSLDIKERRLFYFHGYEQACKAVVGLQKFVHHPVDSGGYSFGDVHDVLAMFEYIEEVAQTQEPDQTMGRVIEMATAFFRSAAGANSPVHFI